MLILTPNLRTNLIFTDDFSAVQKYQGISLRDIARKYALDMLSLQNRIMGVDEWYRKPRIQFLFIHHVFNDEAANFEALLQELSKDHTFISHSEAVNRILKGNIDRPYISWSSDDGFKNNLVAAKILNRFDAKACFFVNPDSIGTNDREWITGFCNERLKMPAVEFVDWEEVEQLQKWGHEIGSHTMNHKNVAHMTVSELQDDLHTSKEILEKHCDAISHFAYPYGRFFDFNKKAFDLVFEAGYTSCSTGERGCHISDGSEIEKNQLLVRRDQVICAWPLRHTMYFIANASKKASLLSNYCPSSMD